MDVTEIVGTYVVGVDVSECIPEINATNSLFLLIIPVESAFDRLLVAKSKTILLVILLVIP